PPGPHALRFYWRSPAEAEPLARPHLGGAYLAGLPAVPLECRLLVPPGYEVASTQGGAASSVIQQIMARARAQLTLCLFLASALTADTIPLLITAQKAL